MIDIEAIKEYTGADDAFIRSLMGQFLSHLDADLEALDTAQKSGNLLEVRRKAHAMLSSAQIFHLAEIISLTQRIEADCEAGRSEHIAQNVTTLISLYGTAESEMELLMNKG